MMKVVKTGTEHDSRLIGLSRRDLHAEQMSYSLLEREVIQKGPAKSTSLHL